MLRRKRFALVALAGVLSVSMLMSACKQIDNGTGTSNGDNNANLKSTYVGTPGTDSITFNLGAEPADMFTVTAQDAPAGDIHRHITTGMTSLDQNDKAVPGVADKWDISADGLTYTFTLNKNFKWSNGEPVTAKDFDYALRLLLGENKDVSAAYNYFGFIIKNAEGFSNWKAYSNSDDKGKKALEEALGGVPKEVKWEDVGFKMPDDYTAVYTLEYPATFFPEYLSFISMMPLNEKAYKDIGSGYGTDADKIVTNGAYKLTSWAHENELVLEKNPDFPRAGDIKIEKITAKIIKDANAAMNAYKSGELDMMGLNSEQAKQMRTEKQPITTFSDGVNSYLQFNTNDPALKNAKIRKALAYAIDSETFIKNIVANSSVAATGFTPPAVLGNKKPFTEEVGKLFTPHDLKAAKKLLEEGMKEEGLTGQLDLTFLTEDSTVATKYSTFLQENLQKDLGIKVTVEQMPFKAKIQRLNDGDFQVVMGLWAPDYNDPMTFLDMWITGGGNNQGGYSNPEYDKLIKDAKYEPDRDKRFGYLMDAEKLLMEDMPVAPYMFRALDYTMSAKLNGAVRTAFQGFNFLYASINAPAK